MGMEGETEKWPWTTGMEHRCIKLGYCSMAGTHLLNSHPAGVPARPRIDSQFASFMALCTQRFSDQPHGS